MRPAYYHSNGAFGDPRSGTWGIGLGVSAGAASGPALKPPDPAPLNPRRRIRAAGRRWLFTLKVR